MIIEDTFPIVSKRDKIQLPENLYGLGERIGAAQIFKDGRITSQELQLAGTIYRVRPGQDIQSAIDKVNELHGGVVVLSFGTHYPTSDINIPAN